MLVICDRYLAHVTYDANTVDYFSHCGDYLQCEHDDSTGPPVDRNVNMGIVNQGTQAEQTALEQTTMSMWGSTIKAQVLDRYHM